MKVWLREIAIGVALFLAVVAIVLFSVGGVSRFVYEAF